MKAERASRCIASPILNISTRWRWVVDRTPQLQLLYLWSPLKRGLGGPQSWSGYFGEEKNLSPLDCKTATLCNKCHQTISFQDIYHCEIAQEVKIKAFNRNAGQSSGNSCAFCKSCYGSSWTSGSILRTLDLNRPICHVIAHVLLHASCFTAAMMPPSLANVCTVC